MTESSKNINEEDKDVLRAAKGNWDVFDLEKLEILKKAAKEWEAALDGVAWPWLCWNVEPDWCLVQQRLVRHVGWTPVVFGDPRSGAPPLEKDAILVDFNRHFNYPIMHFLFPVEFVFLFTKRLAFWHSDLLVRTDVMERLANTFEKLPDGVTAAIDGRRPWYKRWYGTGDRFWELVGCTTASASRDQFEKGAGWWRNIWRHPNCSEALRKKTRRRYYYDHGAGILAWHELHGGVVTPIEHRLVREGHCTRVGNTQYQRQSPQDDRRDLSKDLSYNYDLPEVCRRLEIEHLL